MLTDRTTISRSLTRLFLSLRLSCLARLLVKSTQTPFNQISQKASHVSLCIHDDVDDDDHHHHADDSIRLMKCTHLMRQFTRASLVNVGPRRVPRERITVEIFLGPLFGSPFSAADSSIDGKQETCLSSLWIQTPTTRRVAKKPSQFDSFIRSTINRSMTLILHRMTLLTLNTPSLSIQAAIVFFDIPRVLFTARRDLLPIVDRCLTKQRNGGSMARLDRMCSRLARPCEQ